MTVVKSVSDGLRDWESETQLNLTRPLRISPGPRHLSRPLAAISTSDNMPAVVVTGQFKKKLLHNHFMTNFFLKKKSGDVNAEANFSFFILLHKRAKPIHPAYLLPLPTYPPIPHTPPTHPPTHPPIHPSLQTPIPSSPQPTLNPSVCPVMTVELMDI